MEIAVPVLPFPLRGLGNAYISILRLPWISCQRVRNDEEKFCSRTSLSGESHKAWQRAQRPLEALTGQGGGWHLSLWHLHTLALTACPRTLSFCPQQVSTPGSQTRTAELCIFAFQPGHSHPLSFAHLEVQRFLKPTEVPPVSFTYTGVISSELSSQALAVL